MLRVILASLLCVVVLTSCATAPNTPAQDLAWERWKRCETMPAMSATT